MSFEEYLKSKRIDSENFRIAEPLTWSEWKTEFEQLHPNSFTVQKLNLINPIRRKYTLKVEVAPPPVPEPKPQVTESINPNAVKKESEPISPSSPAKPVMAKPVLKPKPKIN